MQKKALTWKQVHSNHRVIAGIYSQKGKAISILVNTDKKGPYPNKVSKKEITYCLGSQTQSWGIRALFLALENKDKIRIYHKLGVNQWVDLSYWIPESANEEGDFCIIKFVPA